MLSDARFADATRDFVLAWHKIRPAPKVTIDFGDGRTLQRTLKGSTVIYVCRPDGTVVDAYPGIYTPEDFLALLAESRRYLDRTPLQVLKWHKGLGQGPSTRELTASKAALQAPLIRALDAHPGASEPAGLSDMSQLPLTRPEVANRLGLPADASGQDIVIADSARYRAGTRGVTHRLLGSFAGLPRPEQCLHPLFKDVLKVPIDDPYLGLKDQDMPGTP